MTTLKKTKVLYVLANLNQGGLETRLLELVPYFNIEEIEISILIHSESKGVLEDKFSEYDIRIHILPAFRLFSILEFNNELSIFFRQLKFDVVHNNLTSYGVFHLYWAKKNDIQMRISHSRSDQYGNGFFKNIIRFLLSIPNKYLSTHRLAVSELAGKKTFGHKYFEVLQNGFDKEKYAKDDYQGSQFRLEHNIPTNSFLIGHIGRFSKEKNQKFIVDVFLNYNTKNHDSFLVLIGVGKTKKNIVKLISLRKLDDKVLIIDRVETSVGALNAFDLLVFPSLYEGYPGVVVEAQLVECSVIMSESITPRVVVSDKVYRLPLVKEEWLRAIQNVKSKTYIQDNDIHPVMDIEDVAKYLTKLYLQER